jgi:hypothetical protein
MFVECALGMRRFTRLTNGFSKKFENHAHLTDHVWTIAELCALLPQKKVNARVDKELVLKALRA